MMIWLSGSVNRNPASLRTLPACLAVSIPFTRTTPWLGTSRALSIRTNVDLPEPL